MKSKKLALTNGIVGLAGGIILIFGIWFMVGAAVADGDSTSYTALSTVTIFLYILKIAILALGIIGAVYYKGMTDTCQEGLSSYIIQNEPATHGNRTATQAQFQDLICRWRGL